MWLIIKNSDGAVLTVTNISQFEINENEKS